MTTQNLAPPSKRGADVADLERAVRQFLSYVADVRTGRVKRLDRDVVLSLAAEIESTIAPESPYPRRARLDPDTCACGHHAGSHMGTHGHCMARVGGAVCTCVQFGRAVVDSEALQK